jgi:hypothetical protein
MILTYQEFINEQLNVREQLNGICQGDNLPVYKWDAGSVNPKEFDSIFRVEEITDSTLQRMKGKSYPENCEIAVDDLRYLIIPHYDGNGAIRIGELVCNKKVSGAFIYLFKELFKHKFPIERMELVDNYDGDDHRSMEVNNTSAFNYRFVKGTDELSQHAFGMAIDINPLYNPCVRETGVSPKEGEAYADRTIPIKYMLHRGDIVYKILHDKFGFTWGADFENCIDYQHYEKK